MGSRGYFASLDLYRSGVFLFCTSTLLVFFAAICSSKSKEEEIFNFYSDIDIDLAVRTWKYSINHDKYFEKPNATGDMIVWGLGAWFDKYLLDGSYRFDFGNSFYNYCKNESLHNPNNLWTSFSILKASQLNAVVQVCLRASILLPLTHRLLLMIVAFQRNLPLRKTMYYPFIIFIAMINEFLFCFSAFMVTTLHVWQDQKYFNFSNCCIRICLVTFFFKMITGIVATSVPSYCNLVRGAFAMAVVLYSKTIIVLFDQFTEHLTCNQFVLMQDALPEYGFILMLLTSFLLDVLETRNLHIIIGGEKVYVSHPSDLYSFKPLSFIM